MRRVAVTLASVLCALSGVACGGGADSNVPEPATLVLDFQPNAVHAGIYTALRRGFFEDEGLDLEIREPSESTDSLRLLEAGRADFAILDITDLGLARERGLDLVAFGAIVQRPLAAVIAAEPDAITRPRDLQDRTVGVTGLPSDEAVLSGVMLADGADPDRAKRITIGFGAVAALKSGRLDAATGFWNAEGVRLRRLGVPIREFRVDDYRGPRYPELVLATTRESLQADRRPACRMLDGLRRGYEALGRDPEASLRDLVAEVPALDGETVRAELAELMAGGAFRPPSGTESDPTLAAVPTAQWVWWARNLGILSSEPGSVRRARKGFATGNSLRCDSLGVILFG